MGVGRWREVIRLLRKQNTKGSERLAHALEREVDHQVDRYRERNPPLPTCDP